MADYHSQVQMKMGTRLHEALASDNRDVFRQNFLALHPFDQGLIFLNCSATERHKIVSWLDVPELATIFDEFNYQEVNVADLLLELAPKQAAQVIDNLYADNASSILRQLEPDDLALYLSLMPRSDAQRIWTLSGYPAQTAGALMGSDYITVKQTMTIAEAMVAVKKAAQDCRTLSISVRCERCAGTSGNYFVTFAIYQC